MQLSFSSINHVFLKSLFFPLGCLPLYFTGRVNAILKELPLFSVTMPENFPESMPSFFVFPVITTDKVHYLLRPVLPFVI